VHRLAASRPRDRDSPIDDIPGPAAPAVTRPVAVNAGRNARCDRTRVAGLPTWLPPESATRPTDMNHVSRAGGRMR
jgi:hypothetical protein